MLRLHVEDVKSQDLGVTSRCNHPERHSTKYERGALAEQHREDAACCVSTRYRDLWVQQTFRELPSLGGQVVGTLQILIFQR